MHEKGVISVDEKIQKMTINWGASYRSFGTSSKNYKVAKNFTMKKTESNLKLLQGKMLYVNNFFLIDFVLFSMDR